MNRHFKILYYLDHPEIAIVEVASQVNSVQSAFQNVTWFIFYKKSSIINEFKFISNISKAKNTDNIEKGILEKVNNRINYIITISSMALEFTAQNPDKLSRKTIMKLHRLN